MASLAGVRPIPAEELKGMKPGQTLSHVASLKANASTRLIPEQSQIADLPPLPAGTTKAPGQQHGDAEMKKREASIDFSDPASMYNYVMYHHPDSEPSMQCLNVIRDAGLASKIWIQNVEDLSPADIQETPWLDRVPVVVNRKTSEAFKGKNATLAQLEKIPVVGIPKSRDSTSLNVSPSFGIQYQQ